MKNTNYLPSDRYHGDNPQSNGFTSFKDSENNQFYFAYFVKDKLIVKSAGYDTSADRDNGIAAVKKNMKVAKNYHVNKLPDGNWVMSLNDDNNQEIGRSDGFESQKSALAFLASTKAGGMANLEGAISAGKGAIATGANLGKGAIATGANVGKGAIAAGANVGKGAIAAGTGALAAGTGAVAAGAGGFKWAWLLLPLFLIGAFFLYRSCSGDTMTKAVATPPKMEAPKPKVAAPAPAKPKPDVAAAPVAAPISCDLQWILFGFDAYDIRPDARKELDELAALLKKNKDTMASLVAYTDARGSVEYNNNLSRNRANEAKNYLQGKGIPAIRIKTSAKSEADPFAKNTDDDSGRQFNRRVELFLLDADSKEVWGSKAPKISNSLKMK